MIPWGAMAYGYLRCPYTDGGVTSHFGPQQQKQLHRQSRSGSEIIVHHEHLLMTEKNQEAYILSPLTVEPINHLNDV
jgi:hypothetical protein